MQLFLAELMVFGKTAGEEQLVPAGTKPGLFWDPVRGSSSSDPPAQGQVALAPTWPNPPVPQVTLAEQGSAVWQEGSCPSTFHGQRPAGHPPTPRAPRGAAGHQGHLSLPSCGSLPCTGTELWGASPGSCSRLKITLFFRNSLTLAAFARLDLSAELQCQCWHEARGTIIFGKAVCSECLHATLKKLSAPVVTACTGDAFLPQQGCEQP